jgi:uncharacterized integral membrane protein (TIGR00698 family)
MSGHQPKSRARCRVEGSEQVRRPLAVDLLRGIGLTMAISALAFALKHLPALSAFSPMILAILVGTAFNSFIGTPRWAKSGVAFAARKILRVAVILLGLQLTASHIAELGAFSVVFIAVASIATFAFTLRLGKAIGVERSLTELIAAGTAICGASAVTATNTVTRASDEDVTYAVACVTVFGTIAMFLYPTLQRLLNLDAHAYGLWVGASIHEVAQVVAAAFQAGQQAGEIGTVAKLTRVMLLAPMVMVLAFSAQRRARGAGNEPGARAPLPWFVLGFIAMLVLNSSIDIPAEAKAPITTVTTFLLTMGLASMGLETDIRKLKAKGLRPLLLGLGAFLFTSTFCLLSIQLFGRHLGGRP